jgi:hypothetical protein
MGMRVDTMPVTVSIQLTCNVRYRNFLMACAALMDQQIQSIYFALLDDPLPPGVRNLQRWIEAAWKEGITVGVCKEIRTLSYLWQIMTLKVLKT